MTNETQRLTVAQAVVKYLQMQHSEFDGQQQRFIQGMWGIFGHGNVSSMSQALIEYGQDLTYHQPRNEQSMVHACTGFARAKRRKATMACTTSIGPGATNMITGAATATICRIPVLLFPSDYYASRLGGKVLQDIDHLTSEDMSVTDTFRVVSRFYDRVTRPEQIMASLPEAMRILTNPAETGAATIALPQDVQGHAYDFPDNFFKRKVWRIERLRPDPVRIAEAADMIKSARKPYIVAGGGVHYSEAWDELVSFSEEFGIPVGETHAGRGAIRNDSDMLMGGTGHLGTQAAAHMAADADLVICLGTRLHDFVTGSNSAFRNENVKFISINVNGRDAFKLGALPIAADAKLTLQDLTKASREKEIKPNPVWVQDAREAKNNWEHKKHNEVYISREGECLSQGQLIGYINQNMREGDTLLGAAGTVPSDLTKLFDASNGRNLHLEFGNSCMGYDIPAAIGVRLARDDGEIFVLMGDGNYQMHPMELVTAIQERTKIIIILVVNDGYQSIHKHQKGLVGSSLGNEFKIRNTETGLLDDGDFIEVDYAGNAESIGIKSWEADTETEFVNALFSAREHSESGMIIVRTERYRTPPPSNVWWDCAGSHATNDDVTKSLVDERELGRKHQRFYY